MPTSNRFVWAGILFLILFCAVVFVEASDGVYDRTPNTVNYQGYLRTSSGTRNSNVSSCACSGASCTSDYTGTSLQQYWLTSCAAGYATTRLKQ